jgi:hypothetical protein
MHLKSLLSVLIGVVMKPSDWVQTIEPMSVYEMKEKYPDILEKYPGCEFYYYSEHSQELSCGSEGITVKKDGEIVVQHRMIIF